jgi:arginine/lysine/ornithine decarboxylase
LKNNGWQVEETDPMRITIKAPDRMSGNELAEHLRKNRIECEFADEDYLVLMATPENSARDFERLLDALGKNHITGSVGKASEKIPLTKHTIRALTMREAYFAEGEIVPVSESEGRICRMPTATCPPAVPVVVPGELIDEAAVKSFLYYGIDYVEVVKWQK